jgi:hypothetical protein
MFRLIERKRLPDRYDWRVTSHLTFEATQAEGAKSSADFLIVDCYGRPVTYRIG